MERVTLGGGCFWCIEAAFKTLDGVAEATSGYAGGHVEDPTYRAVCSGSTGHAEVVQLTYDPSVVSYETILEVFFTVHDPTQVDRQGPDIGSQYRSAIYTHTDDQYEQTMAFIDALEAEGVYDEPIVTDVEPLDTFYEAEPYHQDYFEKNPSNAYCRMHAAPKVEKVRSMFETTK